MAWKIGKVNKTKIGSELREKFKKTLSSIGMHRNIDRLLKINDKRKLAEEINKIAQSMYPGNTNQQDAYAQMLYNKIEQVKFEKSNRRMLKNLHSAVQKFKRKKLDVAMLSPVCTTFYDEVSSVEDYDEFVSKIFSKYASTPTTIRNCSTEIQKCVNEKKFTTLKLKENDKDKENESGVVSVTVPRDFSTLKSDIFAKIMSSGSEAKRIYDTFTSKYKFLDAADQKEMSGAIALGAFEQVIKRNYYNEVFKQKRSEYKHLWYDMCEKNNQSNVYDIYKNNLIYMIYFLYVYFTPERCEKRANIYMDAWREKRSKKQQPNATGSGSNADTKNAEFHEGGSRVAELKKQIGGKIHGNAFRNPGDSQ